MPRSDDSAGLPSLADAEWLRRPATRAVFDALRAGGAEARAVGGAVRNALMGVPVKDVDIATTAPPDEVVRLAGRAGLHSVPTGIEHGTVTLVVEGHPFEVTTLREDTETFGRKAKVAFGRDWVRDAERRAGDKQPDQRRIVEHPHSARLLLARHVDVGDVDDGRQQEQQDVFGDDADHAEKSLLCMFFIIPAVAPQMYRSSNGMA